MGIGLKILSIIFRANELFSAAIVVGILGHFLNIVDDANGSANALALLFSIALMVPLWCTFRAFPLDFIMFLCWMVAFGLLVDVGG
ncbi:hypothetical protein E4T39_07967 [Aureobasidium subglaciale]|nr:hypothetical protein E4T39_07967 [Aureobasidium subglaciale]